MLTNYLSASRGTQDLDTHQPNRKFGKRPSIRAKKNTLDKQGYFLLPLMHVRTNRR
jgi:hypothetical protein